MDKITLAENLIEFIDESPCSYYAVDNMRTFLLEKGFKELKVSDTWNLKKGESYFILNNGSALIAFTIGSEDLESEGFKIIGSHSDSPGFRIKSNPEIKKLNNVTLNTEVYGGVILSTWFDRPLSVAGRIVIKSDDILNPKVKLLNIDRDIMIIPSLAIHMNRDVNKGFEFNPQKHTLPLLTLSEEKLSEDFFLGVLAEEAGVKQEDILDYDMYLYDRQKGKIIGLENEFISVGRLDNLAMAYGSMVALTSTKPSKGVNVLVCTDNEEVGSRSRQGADSPMMSNTLERIAIGLNKNREEFLRAIENSYIVSADMAHAVHPNFEDMADPTNKPKMGKGPVIKYAANKAYTSDAISGAIFKQLCKSAKVPYQTFFNRSDKAGGSTIGPITASQLNIRSVDIGNPMLSMHSVRELASVDDNLYLYKVFEELYK
ncbi:M18 family aminopeptidase [Anaerosphaera multitolerans]|uniref:M18 family aminopeptidase n=1 Tax=Anaerosphaera multitolerans TaxID=2487351 RepID=A0A437S6Q5_9FIRM|nr:M18 family aminopeptidase [Anaerosphaera multitolerans]RVU54696.1 M18 family aminopeptidase [Anaerosphaera multitolerans]